MKWLLVSPKDRRRAAAWASIGVFAFLAAALAGSLAVAPGPMFWGAAGFVAFVLCTRCALALWRIDDMVFDQRPPWNAEPRDRSEPARLSTLSLQRTHHLRVVSFVILAGVGASSASAQQTLFNVPTADVLDKGKLYFETDWLWRPNAPSFATGSPLRAVYGFGGNVEGGVNFGGINTPGHSLHTVSPNVKWQPYKSDVFTVTTGGFGLFFLRGSHDGNPAAMFYSHGAAKLPTGTRLTAGGFWASSGYAGADAEKGGLFAIEQALTGNVSLAADWYTGNNGLGYASPGVIVTAGQWVFYAAYSIKNGNSKGNGLLLELGFSIP